MIGIVDCNNFYVSCERLFDPSLRNKPVIVLSNNDGCTVARSQEAKNLGIKMGQPLFEITDLIAKHGVIAKSSNYALYGDISQRVMSVIESRSPETFVYSIDEAFINLDGLDHVDLTAWARTLRQDIEQLTGITVGVGVSKTKTLAKVANRLAKKSSKANGALVLDRQDWIDIALRRTEVGDIWGIGPRYSKKLNAMGVHNAFEFSRMSDRQVRSIMNVVGLRTLRELRGERSIPFYDQPEQKKTSCVSRSFSPEILSEDDLREALLSFVERGASKIRAKSLVANKLQIFVLSNRHRKDRPQYSNAAQIDLTPPTNDTRVLASHTSRLLKAIFKEGIGYKKAGIMLLDLCRPEEALRDLFSIPVQEENSLMSAVDALQNRFGRNTVTIGRVSAKSPDWFMTSKNKSPCYTTKWRDIPRIS